MSEETTKPRPECHGRLDTVFPMGADGLRHTPPECLECEVKTECLRRAVGGKEGLAVREERLARAWRAGSVGFLGRWAELKELRRRKGQPRLWAGIWRRWRGRQE